VKLEELLKTEKTGKVAVVQADHEDSLKAMDEAQKQRSAHFILIGNEHRIRSKAGELKISLDEVDIRNTDSDEEASSLAALLAEKGEIDVVMKGLVPTSVFTKALLNKERNLIPSGGLISHVALFDLPGFPHPFLLSDAAINILPDFKQKVEILKNAIAVSRALGISEPETACIAPVEKVNPKIMSTVDADALKQMDFGSAVIDGPMALDVALSKEAALVKGIESPVAGNPDILLFPELNSANGVYKALSFIPGCRHAGILAGLKVPVVLTSRSDSEETRMLSLRLALKSNSAEQD
jgi:phosphate butyryltransferase